MQSQASVPLLPLLINPTCTVTFHLAAWLEGPAAGRWAMRGETGALCWANMWIFGACWCSLEHLLLGTCLSSSTWRSFQEWWSKERWGNEGADAKMGCRVRDFPYCWWMLLSASKSRILGTSSGQNLPPKAKEPCLALSIILSDLWHAGFCAGGTAGDGKVPVPCVLHPVLRPSCPSHSRSLSVTRWEDWARRQRQCHPVHPHIILPYYIVINWTIPLHYFIFEEIYRLSWWLKRQWLKEQCANEWASAQSLFN